MDPPSSKETPPPSSRPSAVSHQSPVEEQKQELERIRETLGPNHPKVAEQLSTLGLYYQHVERDPSTALMCYEQALSVLSDAGEGYEVEIAVHLTDIGNVLRCMDRQEEAVRAYSRAMDMFRESAASSNHPGMQSATRGLALLRAYSAEPETRRSSKR